MSASDVVAWLFWFDVFCVAVFLFIVSRAPHMEFGDD